MQYRDADGDGKGGTGGEGGGEEKVAGGDPPDKPLTVTTKSNYFSQVIRVSWNIISQFFLFELALSLDPHLLHLICLTISLTCIHHGHFLGFDRNFNEARVLFLVTVFV